MPKVTIEIDLRRLDPISEDEEPPSDVFDDHTAAKAESAIDDALQVLEQMLFDRFGWTFDQHTVEVTL